MKRLIAMATLAALAGCGFVTEYSGNEDGKVCPVVFAIDSPGTRSSFTGDAGTIGDFCLLAYSGGSLQNCFATSDLKGTSVKLSLRVGKEYTFYALANMQMSTAAQAFVNESQIQSFAWDSSVGIQGFNENGIPMCHVSTRTIRSGEAITISMKRLVTKIRLSICKDELPSLQITSAKLCRTAGQIHPFTSKASGYVGSGEDCTVSADAQALDRGEWIELYAPENLQGTLLPGNSDPYQKNYTALVNAGKKASADLCTYIEISGRFSETDDAQYYSGNITYRFYPGKDLTTNFDLERNTEMSIRFRPTANSATDNSIVWKVDNSDVSLQENFTLHIYTADGSGTIINEVTGNQLTMFQGLTSGMLKVTKEVNGVETDITSGVEWRLQSGTLLNMTDNRYINSLNASNTSDVTETVTVSYGSRSASLTTKILTAGSPSVTFKASSANGSQTKSIPTDGDITVYGPTYKGLMAKIESSPIWESATLRINGIRNESTTSDLASGNGSIYIDYFTGSQAVDKYTVLSTDSNKDTYTVTLKTLQDSWNYTYTKSLPAKTVIPAIEVKAFAVYGPFQSNQFLQAETGAYATVIWAWNNNYTIGGETFSNLHDSAEGSYTWINAMPLHFAYSGDSFPSNEYDFDLDGSTADCTRLIEVNDLWIVPYASPGYNLIPTGTVGGLILPVSSDLGGLPLQYAPVFIKTVPEAYSDSNRSYGEILNTIE